MVSVEEPVTDTFGQIQEDIRASTFDRGLPMGQYCQGHVEGAVNDVLHGTRTNATRRD
jgi:hypothetical protein